MRGDMKKWKVWAIILSVYGASAWLAYAPTSFILCIILIGMIVGLFTLNWLWDKAWEY